MNKYTHRNLKGSGSNQDQFYKGLSYQKGYGIGDQFRRFFSWITPIFRKHALPKIQSGLKKVGEEIINSTANVAKDVIQGRSFSESANENVNNSVQNIKEAVENSLEGKGKSKIKKPYTIFKKIQKNNSKNKKDIFD
jgi:(p)ppGpp synthase/HD superfamily hydrolase